jgi:hypothetical protein
MAKARMDLSTFVGKLLEEQDGDVHHTRGNAEADNEHFDGYRTE